MMDIIKEKCNELKYSNNVQKEALYLYKSNGFSGRSFSNNTEIAACIYLSGLIHGEKRMQKEVSNIFNISSFTLRKAFRHLIKNRVD